MANFRTIDRETGFLLPPSVDEWLPELHLGALCCRGRRRARPSRDERGFSRLRLEVQIAELTVSGTNIHRQSLSAEAKNADRASNRGSFASGSHEC
jgi:hypothetical protein